MASERDDTPFSKAPSYFASSTLKMKQRGAEVLLKATAELEPDLGKYLAESIAAQIFDAMIKAQADS